MFLNLKGPNEVRIDDVWYNRDHNASITFSQSDERVRLVLKSNGHEVSKASFSKRDLPRLMDLFKNQRRFVFDSFSAAGSLKFDGSMSSNDFRLIFPGESESILMVADFSRALETMKGKPTDLYRMYPEIAKAVDAQTAISDKVVWALSFRVDGLPKRKDLLRYRGNPLFDQVMQLLRAAGVKNKAETTNRAWTEFAEEGSGGASKLVDQHLFNFAAEYSMANNIVDGFFQANHYFVNGMEVSKNKFDFHSGRADKSNLGDVIVAVIDPGRTMDDELEFSEMPQILIYKAELDGPYTLPGFAGKTPLDLYSTEASDALNLGSDDCVICPKCGELDCYSHPMAKGSLVYILRADRSDKFLFAFQANLLGNATEKLIPFAPAIIRRDVKNRMSLPEEVFLIEINGDNVGDTLCLRTIRRGDTVKIVIR